MLVRHLLLFIFLKWTTADDDREYCSLTFTTPTLAAASADASLLAANVHGGHRQPSELVSFVQSTGAVSLIFAEATGAFPASIVPITTGVGASTFCAGGILRIADINGDSFDDLLCEASGGVFSYRLYNYDSYLDSAVLDTTTTFTCDTSADAAQVLIGDFDHNGSEDIFCLTVGATVGSTSSIYFTTECLTGVHYHFHVRHGRHAGYPYGDMQYSRHFAHHNYYHHQHCHYDLPKIFTFSDNYITTCATPTNDLIVADVNGDHRDDLVCHKSDNTISYFLSRGITSGSLFASEHLTPSAVTCTFADNKIIASDVDGDEDEDLVCVNRLADGTAINEVAHFTSGDYEQFETEGTTCSLDVCADAATNDDVHYTVGDFNHDGAQDYLCHWFDATNTLGLTRIFFSAPIS